MIAALLVVLSSASVGFFMGMIVSQDKFDKQKQLTEEALEGWQKTISLIDNVRDQIQKMSNTPYSEKKVTKAKPKK